MERLVEERKENEWERRWPERGARRLAADGAAMCAGPPPRANRRYNKHSYKFSGLANLNKTLDIGAEGNSVTISKSSTRKAGKLAKSLVNKCARRTNYAAGAEAKSVRPDLKVRLPAPRRRRAAGHGRASGSLGRCCAGKRERPAPGGRWSGERRWASSWIGRAGASCSGQGTRSLKLPLSHPPPPAALQSAAQARASAVHRSLRKKKALAKAKSA